MAHEVLGPRSYGFAGSESRRRGVSLLVKGGRKVTLGKFKRKRINFPGTLRHGRMSKGFL